jgi:anti-sigma regulatory factor (Ser/Thr protein kinase)
MSLRLERSRESPDIARRAVSAALGGQVSQQFIEDAILCTSELVTNAVMHGKHGCELQMSFDPADGGVLRVEVSDGSPHLPRLVDAVDVHRAGGRGLRIVEAASTRWGSQQVPSGKVVWFEMGHPSTVEA